MISSVTFEKTTYNVLPYKFEAGTPNIAGDHRPRRGDRLRARRSASRTSTRTRTICSLTRTERLAAIPGVRIIGTAREKAAVLSFALEGVHPHDVGTILDQEGIAVRTGHHCAQPVMDFFRVPATARASFALYNTREEMDVLVEGIHKVVEMFRP